MIHLSKVTAAELSPSNIRVNAICPGLIATSIFGASMGLPREVADQMAARIEEVAPKFQPVPKAGVPKDIAEAALCSWRPTLPPSSPAPTLWWTAASRWARATPGARKRSRPFWTRMGITAEQAQAMAEARKAAQNG